MSRDFWINACLWTTYAVVALPSWWVSSRHAWDVRRLHKRCERISEDLAAKWRAGQRDAARLCLKEIDAIEADIRRWISPPCRAVLTLWVFFFAALGLCALHQVAQLSDIGDFGFWASPYALYVSLAFSAYYVQAAVYRRQGLPRNVGTVGREWADAMTAFLERENAARRQAQADAEAAARKAQESAQPGVEKRFWEEYQRNKQAEVTAAAELEAKTILGLEGKFTIEDLDQARRRLVKKLHPDLVATRDNRTRRKREDKLKRVNAAYDVLKPKVLN